MVPPRGICRKRASKGRTVGYRKPQRAGVVTDRIGDIRRVLWVILALNVGVAVAKLAWGALSDSAAMQADGFHSLFDGASNVVGLVGMGMAARPADKDHPYGHGKYETYASAAIGAMLLLAAYRIGSTAFAQLAQGAAPPRVTAMSFVVMLVTLAVNLGVTLWERRVGRELGSEILVADANHTTSDILVSVGVIASLVLVRLGFDKADPIVAVLVAGAILYTALAVFRHASATLSDSARIPVAEICVVVERVSGVRGCHHIRTRGSAAEVYVDLHVQVDSRLSVAEGHAIAETVERVLCDEFSQIVDAIVHLEPFDDYQRAKTAEEIDAGLV